MTFMPALLEVLHEQVRQRAASRGRVAELVRILFRVVDEFAQRLHRHRGVHHQRHRQIGDHADGVEILQSVVLHVAVEVRIDEVSRKRRKRQYTAVGGRTRKLRQHHAAALPGLVLHDYGMTKRHREPLGDHARHDVRRLARRKADQDARRPALRLRARRNNEQANRTQNPVSHAGYYAAMGPLTGLKILEFEAIGPGPFCGMMLADMGADVLLVDRSGDPRLGLGRDRWFDVMVRGRRSATLDLKSKGGVEAAIELTGRADAIIEGFRPGVMERLGLGPDVLLRKNPKLVYGRMTGWGQDGPLAPRAGHDINYIALSGVLHAFGRAGGAPVPPLNLVGDFGGGGMLLAFGIACALVEAQKSGKGQVVDAAMVDGASTLAAMFSGMLAAGRWSETRGENILDTGAPWYDTYETKDGRYVAIGSIEPKFYEDLLLRLNLSGRDLPKQMDRKGWPALRKVFSEKFLEKSRDEWCKVFDGSDACFAPVLTFSEARNHPHNMARKAFTRSGKVDQPAPAPRFSRTPGAIRRAPPERGEGGAQALADWGFSNPEIGNLKSLGLNFRE